MSEQISATRIGALLSALRSGGQWGLEGEEVQVLLEEIVERRKQASYTRQQRLDFMLRIVKDSMPEIAKELREIFNEQQNALYYARRPLEWTEEKKEG